MDTSTSNPQAAKSDQSIAASGRAYHLWHPFTPMKQFIDLRPLIMERGEGPYLFTAQGKRFLNLTSCLWNAPFGLGCRPIIDSINRQLGELGAASLFRASHPAAIELARRVSEVTPDSLNHVFLTSNGSESVESAIKLVRQYYSRLNSNKYKIISLDNAYHGVSYGALAASGFGDDQVGFGPMPEGFLHVPRPDAREASQDTTEQDHAISCADALEALICREDPETVAAFLLEPVQGQGGVIIPTQGYYDRVVEICRKYDVKLIFDEVTTGFCRTGTFFAAERWGIEPDIMCLGKAMGGGYFPLGAVVASDEIWDAFQGKTNEDQFKHGSTHSGHPGACAAGLAVLDLLADGSMAEHVVRRGEYFSHKLQGLTDLPIVSAVRGIGLMFAIDLVRDKHSGELLDAAAMLPVFQGMFAKGLWVHPAESKVLLLPPFIMDEAVLDEAYTGLHDVLARAHAWI